MKKGFTILEILIVIVLIVVFSGLSIPYFHTATNDKQLDQEVKALSDYIELAKDRSAASSVGEMDVAQCKIFRGYEILFNSTTRYTLRGCCTANVGSPTALCSYSKDLKIYNLPNGFSMSYSGNLASPNNLIFFPVLQLGTLLSSDATITIKSTNISKCIPITVNIVGTITEGPKVSC